jgi:CRISPR-associated protein Cmr3
MIHYLEISARDPLIARDGRPFGAAMGQRMKSLDWLYPSVTAGMVRTLLGEKNGGDFSPDAVKILKKIDIAGALPMSGSQLFFPAPEDAAIQEGMGGKEKGKKRIAWAGRPHKLHEGEGTDLPPYLLPVVLPPSVADFKPAKGPSFWSAPKMTEWLLNASGVGFGPPPDTEKCTPEALLPLGYLKIEKDERFHVNIEPGTYAARDTHLFMTVALAIPEDVRISVRVKADAAFDSHLNGLDQWAAMGGERRLVHVSAAGHEDSWACPGQIREALNKTNLVRMVVAAPALFKHGWKPGWIGDDGKGEFAGVKLQLIGACVERWKPVSGWSYEAPRGPKAALRLVPSGSVYFFQTEGNASSLADQWLKPVGDFSEDGQSGRDGFGLALWGPWASHSE